MKSKLKHGQRYMTDSDGTERLLIESQPGPQRRFAKSNAKIVIFGGAAGGGKTWSLLFAPWAYLHEPGFSAVMFRRKTPDIRKPGGLWPESVKLYSHYPGAEPNESNTKWKFYDDKKKLLSTIVFSHLEYIKDIEGWMGSQICYLAFDQLEQFEEEQFFKLFGRNRSTSGVTPFVRATANPDTDSWLAKFIEWWIGEDGYPIAKRDGVIRWFTRKSDDTLEWHDAEVPYSTSVTFIASKLHDNAILMELDPDYETTLMQQTFVERERLLMGNWKVKASAGLVFNREWFGKAKYFLKEDPDNVVNRVRFWDKAATHDGGDYTVGVKMSVTAKGVYAIEHVVRGQWSAAVRDAKMMSIAKADGTGVNIGIEKEGGSGGKSDAEASAKMLAGYSVKLYSPTTNKLSRSLPFSSQCEIENVKIVEGSWNDQALNELHGFPDAKHDDVVDACSGAFNMLAEGYGSIEMVDWSPF